MLKTPIVRPFGPSSAPILIVGEAPGREESEKGRPFVGSSGKELHRMLKEVGISQTQVRLDNVFQQQPPGNNLEYYLPKAKTLAEQKGATQIDEKWATPEAAAARDALRERVRAHKPKVIIALGEAALWALAGKTRITKWRGSNLDFEGIPLIPTYHPTSIMRQWSWRGIAVTDMRKALKLKDNPEANQEPSWDFVTRPTLAGVRAWVGRVREAAKQRRRDANGSGVLLPPIPPESAPHIAGQRRELHNRNPNPLPLAVDIETRGGHIACIGVADSDRSAICVPLIDSKKENGHYWGEDEEVEVVRLLRDLLCDPNIAVVGQNYHYDALYMCKFWGFYGRLKFDTMTAHHTLFAGDMPKGLDFLASIYCRWHRYWKDDGRNWDPRKHSEDDLWFYNCRDCVVTLESAFVLSRLIPEANLLDAYSRQFWQFAPVLRMQVEGTLVDRTLKESLSMSLMEDSAKRYQWVQKAVGWPININSPVQMKKLFYEELGCKVVRNKKTKKPTCDDDALKKISEREPVLRPLCHTIQEIRTLEKLQSNVVNRPMDADGRWRSSFNTSGTETFRWSSSTNAFGGGMNLQNITKGEKAKGSSKFRMPNLRKLFLPDPGFEVADVDLDRADVQVVAWDSGDQALKDKLLSGEDVHLMNAADIFGGDYGSAKRAYKSGDTEWKVRRVFAKAFAHATNYGAGARTLAITLGITVREAEQAMARWFAAHPGIADWHSRIETQLWETREVRNIFGYRRLYLDRIQGLLPEALAWVPQSTVAHIINIALCKMHDEYPNLITPMIQVHDSLVFQYPRHKRDTALSAARECLSVEMPYDDPRVIPIGFEVGYSWGHTEGYEERKAA